MSSSGHFAIDGKFQGETKKESQPFRLSIYTVINNG
jgi:hypothetical protein